MDTLYSCTSLPSTVHAVKVPTLTTTTCSSSSRQLESIHLHHHQTSKWKYPNPPLNRNHLLSSQKNHQISSLDADVPVNSSATVHWKAAAGYAAALIDVSQCSGSLPQVQRDMRRLSLLLRDRQIQVMLSNPTDSSGKGLETMKEIGKKLKFSKHSMALVKLLIGKKKVELIGEVVDEFRRIYSQMLFSLSTPLPLHYEAADMMYNDN